MVIKILAQKWLKMNGMTLFWRSGYSICPSIYKNGSTSLQGKNAVLDAYDAMVVADDGGTKDRQDSSSSLGKYH